MRRGSTSARVVAGVSARAPYRRYLLASHAANTKRAYAMDVAHFRRWGGRIPATPTQVARYLSAYAGKLAFATLSRRVAGLHREHLARGLRSPASSELVRATLRGIGRTYSRRQRKVKPLLPHHLRRMSSFMRGALGARDRALLLLGFMGGLRRSELAALDLGSITIHRWGLAVMIRRSKTDQDAVGRTIRVPRMRGALCPVRAMERWLKRRGQAEAALFTSLTPHGHVTMRRLSATSIATRVKRRVWELGLNPSEYSGHSLRAGFVTSAARAGASMWQIREQTGHKSDAVLAGYIRDGAAAGANAARLIGRGREVRS